MRFIHIFSVASKFLVRSSFEFVDSKQRYGKMNTGIHIGNLCFLFKSETQDDTEKKTHSERENIVQQAWCFCMFHNSRYPFSIPVPSTRESRNHLLNSHFGLIMI